MDTKHKSLLITFLTLILLASMFASLLSVSEARPLLSSSLSGKKDGMAGEVNGVFRTLKSSGPSPGISHRVKKLQNQNNLGHITESGPSPGKGHRLGEMKKDSAGPSPGIGHRLNNKLQNLIGERKDSGPSPGGGGH